MSRKKATVLVVAAAAVAVAATSTSYMLWPAVIDQGGGRAESQDYQLDASIGGPVIATTAGGTATSASYKLEVNSMAFLEGPAKALSTGGGGGCAPGGAAGALAFCGMLACVMRATRRVRASEG